MDHPPGREVPRRGGHRLAGGEPVRVAVTPDRAALRQDGRSAAAVDRPVDPPAAQERTVRGVHDGVDGLVGDVPADQFDAHRAGHLGCLAGMSARKGSTGHGTRLTPLGWIVVVAVVVLPGSVVARWAIDGGPARDASPAVTTVPGDGSGASAGPGSSPRIAGN